MKYISLFAGIGGFDVALNKLGHECVYANEWDKYAAQIYNKNFSPEPTDEKSQQAEPEILIRGERSSLEGERGVLSADQRERRSVRCDTRDLRTVPTSEIPDHDLLVGGFPCQAFSIAGKRRGFEDTRGTLFFDVARILKDKHPSYFILENVKGLLSHDGGRTFKTIISTLTELRYDLQWQVLNSKNFGVPQNRERVYIVGHLRGQPRPQVFPITGNSQEDAIVTAPHQTYPSDQVADTLTVHYAKNQHGNQYVAEDIFKGGPVPVIRRLTPLECERLQGFPDGWTEGISDTQRYKCLGNAVTTNVVYEVAKRIKI